MEFRQYKGGLKPYYRFLSDKAVIVQAWKKAHEYLRRHNWYSDNLDLDLSCINLENLYQEIQGEFSNDGRIVYQPSPMRLVYAPKSCDEWGLAEGVFNSPASFELRPLAHLQVKDQVVAMMFLMCLANIIEKRQGVARPVKELRCLTDVVSYGNRLISDAVVGLEDDDVATKLDEEASFLWGNSETYNRYYTDYQNFIARPMSVLRRLRRENEGLSYCYFIVSLDLSKFYDRIDRACLFEKVCREIEADGHYDEPFLVAFKRMLMWQWDERDRDAVELYQKRLNCGISDGNAWARGGSGIPQGLAASGFLANIYLLAFDDDMKRIVQDGQRLGEDRCLFRVHDYCRYVDDMRLVVSVNAGEKADTDAQLAFVENVRSILLETCPGLDFAAEKVSWEEIPEVPVHDFVSVRMSESKRMASGSMDERSARELIELNRALWTEAADVKNEETNLSKSLFAKVQLPRHRTGVKADRLERFAANNWRRAYRVLMGMLETEEEKDPSDVNNVMSMSALNMLTDEFCEEILKRWMKDPSKVRVLRIALDLRPKREYLELILTVLWSLYHADENARFCAAYVLAEVFRAAAIETGFSYAGGDSKYSTWRENYRRFIHEQVPRFIELDLPWFTANQIALFELTYDKGVSLTDGRLLPACDDIYRQCHSLINGTTSLDGAAELPVATFVLAYLLSHDSRILDRYREVIYRASKVGAEDQRKCRAFLPVEVASSVCPVMCAGNEPSLKGMVCDVNSKGWRNLREIVFSGKNPFDNEVAIVRLGIALWEFIQKTAISRKKFYTLQNLAVSCTGWDELSNAASCKCVLVVREDGSSQMQDDNAFMFEPEPWEGRDFVKLAQIGRILRAVAMSGDEYSVMRRQALTLTHSDVEESWPRFLGVRSTWLKRRYGLYFDRVCLGGVHVSFSPWFTELLSALLAWPGSFVATKYRKLGFAKLLVVLKSRLEDLSQFGCIDSETIMIPVDVDLRKFCNGKDINQRKINVAVVQTLHPDTKCLEDASVRESVAARKKSRRHLSNMIEMLEKTFVTHSTLMQKNRSINLVVFPELSVYPRDIVMLKRFADSKNCMVFCGLVYCKDPSDSNKSINTGLWIIPQRRDSQDRRVFIELPQGKKHLAHMEAKAGGLHGYRPVQWIVRGIDPQKKRSRKIWSMSASICYDATDVRLAAALRDHVDCFVVSAFNPDVNLFDMMAESWRYHMYGHTVLANTGIFGGSTIQAPYKNAYERIIAHAHGANQAQILLASMELKWFERPTVKLEAGNKKRKHRDPVQREVKTSPAGYIGRRR